MAELRYSIIVATYNRLDEVRELISSFKGIDFDPKAFEIVIVDDGSTDGTKDYVQSLKTPFAIQYIEQQNQGPGSARNNGMRHAKGTYFIYIDSDCMVPPHYLKEIDQALHQYQWDAFGGPDTFHPSFPPILKAINYSMTSFIGTLGTRGSKKGVGKFYPRSFNMGLRREIFEDIGGMNALRHGQDMDFTARIYKAGYTVGLIPEAFVYHKRRTNLKKYFKQIFNWGVARVNLAKDHPELLKPIHMLPMFLLLFGLLCLMLSPLLAPFALLLRVGLSFAALIAIAAFIQASWIYRNPYIGLLSVITTFMQVFAYALGMSSAWWQKLRGKETALGFTKNYYK